MTSIRWCALAVALATAAGGWAQSQFWGELKAGKYAVGFRSLYQLDVARSYDADYPAPGSTAVKKPRPIFLAIWYPAAEQHDTAMVYRDYFRASSVDSPVPEFAQRLRKFTRDMACQYMLGKEFDTLTEEERVAWDGLLATPVYATLNVPAAAGKFPVVIYHPGLGGTFEDNAVACEYLASHGYVVLSSAYQAADSSNLNIDGDLDDIARGFEFPVALCGHAAVCRSLQGGRDGAQLRGTGHARVARAAQFGAGRCGLPGFRRGVPPAGRIRHLQGGAGAESQFHRPVVMFADSRRQPRFEVLRPVPAHSPRAMKSVWTAWSTTISSVRARSEKTTPFAATTRPSAA